MPTPTAPHRTSASIHADLARRDAADARSIAEVAGTEEAHEAARQARWCAAKAFEAHARVMRAADPVTAGRAVVVLGTYAYDARRYRDLAIIEAARRVPDFARESFNDLRRARVRVMQEAS